jgi:hypothetical protein
MHLLEADEQIISDDPFHALSTGPRSGKWGLPAGWRQFRLRSRQRGRSNVLALVADLQLELEAHKTALSLPANQERDGAGTFERDPSAIGQSKFWHYSGGV